MITQKLVTQIANTQIEHAEQHTTNDKAVYNTTSIKVLKLYCLLIVSLYTYLDENY